MGDTKRIFISHKANDYDLADAIVNILKLYVSGVDFFLAENIRKGDEWRKDLERELQNSDHLVLIYTNPEEDWSWCVYETAIFNEVVCKNSDEHAREHRGTEDQIDLGTDQRIVYCIHFPESPPPGPFQKIQTIRAENEDLFRWLSNDLWNDLWGGTKPKPDTPTIQQIADQLASKLEEYRPINEITYLWPSILVSPPRAAGKVGFNSTERLGESQTKFPNVASLKTLGINFETESINLMDFLQTLDQEDANGWIERLFESIVKVLQGLDDEDIIFFRGRNARIFRPIIETVRRSVDGQEWQLRLVFVDAFASPLANSDSPLERLVSALRIAVRTRIEVLDQYQGRMAQKSQSSEHDLPAGHLLIATFENILLESKMEGNHWDGSASLIFEGEQQIEYVNIHDEFKNTYNALKICARHEDSQGAGNYAETEALLQIIRNINDQYFKLAAPRFSSMLGVPPLQGERSG